MGISWEIQFAVMSRIIVAYLFTGIPSPHVTTQTIVTQSLSQRYTEKKLKFLFSSL